MPCLSRLLAIPVLLLPVVMGSALAAQDSPSRTGARRAGIDVLHYEFRVDFPARAFPDTIQFTATTTAVRREASSLSLDLTSAMRVDSTRVNGFRVSFTRPGDSVRVALPSGRNDTVRVAVFYRGLPNDGLIVRRDSVLGWTAFGDNFPDRARQWLARALWAAVLVVVSLVSLIVVSALPK